MCVCIYIYVCMYTHTHYDICLYIDIDECAANTHKCGTTGRCENTKGSYICHCGHGYNVIIENNFQYCQGKQY